MINNVQELVDGLTDRNDTNAYQCLKELVAESENSDAVYAYFPRFAEMLGDASSYIRTRGILLIAANAKWDRDNKIDEVIDDYLTHISDDKPITARQTIKALPTIAKYKPELRADISQALRKANPHIYKSTMQPLITKDIQEALKDIEKLIQS